jgi:hypothetical protein
MNPPWFRTEKKKEEGATILPFGPRATIQKLPVGGSADLLQRRKEALIRKKQQEERTRHNEQVIKLLGLRKPPTPNGGTPPATPSA